jgi:hypothetical protein
MPDLSIRNAYDSEGLYVLVNTVYVSVYLQGHNSVVKKLLSSIAIKNYFENLSKYVRYLQGDYSENHK